MNSKLETPNTILLTNIAQKISVFYTSNNTPDIVSKYKEYTEQSMLKCINLYKYYDIYRDFNKDCTICEILVNKELYTNKERLPEDKNFYLNLSDILNRNYKILLSMSDLKDTLQTIDELHTYLVCYNLLTQCMKEYSKSPSFSITDKLNTFIAHYKDNKPLDYSKVFLNNYYPLNNL